MTPRLILLLVLSLALAGCGAKAQPGPAGAAEQLRLVLDYFPNADHAGIYAAEAGRHFDQAGISVKVRQPTDPSAPIKQVAAGRVDLAVSYEPEVLRARDRGLNVVAVGALVRRPLTSIISLPGAKIRTPADLEGKTVGTAGIDYKTAFLREILLDASVDPDSVEERNVGFRFSPALLSGRVDATLGAFWNYEGTDLRLKGRDPQILRVDEVGVPTYNELVLVANEDSLERDGDRIRAFIAAVARGTADMREKPGAAVDGLLDANPDLDPELQRAAVRATQPLFEPERGRPFGYQDPTEWQAFAAWMRENRLLTKIPDASGAFTNDYLPGGGP